MEMSVKKIAPESWFVLLTICGYIFVSGLAIPLNVDNSRIFAVPYRFFIFGFSLIILYRNFSFSRVKSLFMLMFIVFWILYAIKAAFSFQNDFYLPEFLKTKNEIFVRILTIVFFPSMALMMINYDKVDLKWVARGMFFILLFMLTGNLIYGFFMPHQGFKIQTIFSAYYISYGHFGTSLSIISLFFLLFEKGNIKHKLFYGLTFLLGCFTILIVTARSPFLALIVVALYILTIKRNIKYLLIYFSILVLILIGVYWYTKSGYTELKFINRTYAWIFEGNNSLRTPLFERSLLIFKENPVLGGRILYEEGSYPHNIFLELLMATGIIGFILYFLKFLPVFATKKLYLSNKTLNSYYILFFALFLQYFVLVITSYNLFSVPEFLHFSALIIGISINFINEKTKSNDGGRNPSRNH